MSFGLISDTHLNPLRTAFVWWPINRLFAVVPRLTVIDMGNSVLYETRLKFWSQQIWDGALPQLSHSGVPIIRDFGSQMVRETIEFHVHFLKISDMWKRMLLPVHYLCSESNARWHKTKTCLLECILFHCYCHYHRPNLSHEGLHFLSRCCSISDRIRLYLAMIVWGKWRMGDSAFACQINVKLCRGKTSST